MFKMTLNFAFYSYVLLLLVTMSNLQITGWNVRSLTCAGPYLQELLELHSDMLFIAEHRLYSHELHKLKEFNPNFSVIAKASNDLDNANQGQKLGHCGTAMFINNDLAHCTKSVDCDSDRIIAIEVIQPLSKNILVIGVYLPQRDCKITCFESHLNELMKLITMYKDVCDICIIGDFNCHFGSEIGNRFWGKTTPNAKKLFRAMEASDMYIIDANDDVCCGPKHTFHSIQYIIQFSFKRVSVF